MTADPKGITNNREAVTTEDILSILGDERHFSAEAGFFRKINIGKERAQSGYSEKIFSNKDGTNIHIQISEKNKVFYQFRLLWLPREHEYMSLNLYGSNNAIEKRFSPTNSSISGGIIIQHNAGLRIRVFDEYEPSYLKELLLSEGSSFEWKPSKDSEV